MVYDVHMTTITIDAPTLRSLLEGAAVAAGTDKTLPMLNAVNLEWAPGRLTAVATDRYRMCVGEVPVAGLEDSGSILLPLDDVRELIRALPKLKRGLVATVAVSVGEREATFTGDGWTRKIDALDATFVAWSAIMWDHENERGDVNRIGFNATLLAGMAKVPTEKGQPWVLNFKKPEKPVIATCYLGDGSDRIDWRYLIMPVRLPD